jgi:hypothetical protein
MTTNGWLLIAGRSARPGAAELAGATLSRKRLQRGPQLTVMPDSLTTLAHFSISDFW